MSCLALPQTRRAPPVTELSLKNEKTRWASFKCYEAFNARRTLLLIGSVGCFLNENENEHGLKRKNVCRRAQTTLGAVGFVSAD